MKSDYAVSSSFHCCVSEADLRDIQRNQIYSPQNLTIRERAGGGYTSDLRTQVGFKISNALTWVAEMSWYNRFLLYQVDLIQWMHPLLIKHLCYN